MCDCLLELNPAFNKELCSLEGREIIPRCVVRENYEKRLGVGVGGSLWDTTQQLGSGIMDSSSNYTINMQSTPDRLSPSTLPFKLRPLLYKMRG